MVDHDGGKGVTCRSCSAVPVDEHSPELMDPVLSLARIHSWVRNGEQALKIYCGAASLTEDKYTCLALYGVTC